GRGPHRRGRGGHRLPRRGTAPLAGTRRRPPRIRGLPGDGRKGHGSDRRRDEEPLADHTRGDRPPYGRARDWPGVGDDRGIRAPPGGGVGGRQLRYRRPEADRADREEGSLERRLAVDGLGESAGAHRVVRLVFFAARGGGSLRPPAYVLSRPSTRSTADTRAS